MARAAWTGAINFAGFPIHLCAYSVQRSSESFKQLAPTDFMPVKQQLVDSNGDVVAKSECLKGVEQAKNQWRVVPSEAIEALSDGDRSATLEPDRFAPRASVPLHMSNGLYRLIPDPKTAGSEGPAGILWNGLIASERVLLTEITMRAGSRPSVFAIHADADGLNGNKLPYVTDFNAVPQHSFEVNEQARTAFETFASQNYSFDPFDHGAFVDDYSARRAEIIAKALAGEEIELPTVAAPTPAAAPDLMAALEASLQKGAKKAAGKNGGTKVPA